MKSYYKPFVFGFAALMTLTPAINLTNVAAATNTSSSAITQSTGSGYNALYTQIKRATDDEDSGKYGNAQQITLQSVIDKYYGRLGKISDSQDMQDATELKDYLDKGIVAYTIEPFTSVWITNIEDASDFYGSDYSAPAYVFKEVNKPELKKLDIGDHTVVDKNNHPVANNEVPMWIDNEGYLNIDSNYSIYGTHPQINVIYTRDIDKYSNNPSSNSTDNPWTSSEGVITTKHMSFLYTLDGNKVDDRALSGNSAWYTDRYATINGEKMYRVSTDEWVKSSDIE